MKPTIKYQYFILFWAILNLVQAYFTELTSDEGYYWFYSTQLELGYYDHPPMVALLIHFGQLLFQNEFGVRCLNILLVSGSLFLFFELLPKKLRNNHWLYILLLAVPLLNYVNILVFPDTPLLAFEILFLFAFKRFLEKEDWQSIFLIGISVALMFYSKYHGVLVLGFAMLSNPKLFLNLKIYIAGFIALFLFTPHLWWQYSNDFPTFAYHLDGRISGYSTKFIFGYITQQLLFFTPLLLIIPFLYKTQNDFERALKFIVIGTLGFFLFTSLRTLTHFHWTSIALIPAIVLTTLFYEQSTKKRFINIGIGMFLMVMILFRIYLIVPIFPTNNLGVDYFHERDNWTNELTELSEGRPVIFENNLREAGLYGFYSGKTSAAIYTSPGKKSQFELWNYEEKLQGKKVMLVNSKPFDWSKPLETKMGQKIEYALVDNFVSYQNLIIEPVNEPKLYNDTLELEIEIFNPRMIEVPFETEQPMIVIDFHSNKKSKLLPAIVLNDFKNIAPNERLKLKIKADYHELDFKPTHCNVGIYYKYFYHSINSKKIIF